jgi:hypothetical protein
VDEAFFPVGRFAKVRDAPMTTELQRVMARYEEARIEYKKAVLSSLNGGARGEAIRQAIRNFQDASSELRRVTGAPARPASSPNRAARTAPAPRQAPSFGFAFFRRLLSAG